MTHDQFVQCCKTQGNLDLEVWDVALWQPLRDVYAWWSRQSSGTQSFTAFLLGRSQPAFARWIAVAAGVAEAELGVAFGAALIAVAAGIGLGTALDVIGRCGIMDLEEEPPVA
jgi:hypothetical protein